MGMSFEYTEVKDFKNSEGYADYTAYKAIKQADGAVTKAYYTMKTLINVARLANLEIVGTVYLRDRTGKVHDGQEVVWRRENVDFGHAEET